PEGGNAALTLAKQITHSANAQIGARDLEAVVGRTEYSQSIGGLRADVPEQDAEGLLGATPDPAAELVKLRETESLGVLDEHHRRVRHVDSHFDHRRRNEDVDLSIAKLAHDRVALRGVDTSVNQRDASMREGARHQR